MHRRHRIYFTKQIRSWIQYFSAQYGENRVAVRIFAQKLVVSFVSVFRSVFKLQITINVIFVWVFFKLVLLLLSYFFFSCYCQRFNSLRVGVLSHRRNPVDWYPVALACTYSAFTITFLFPFFFSKPSRAQWLAIAFIQYALFWFLLVLKCLSNCKANWVSLFFYSIHWIGEMWRKKRKTHEGTANMKSHFSSIRFVLHACASFPSLLLFNCLCFWHFKAVMWAWDEIQTRTVWIQTGNLRSQSHLQIKLKIKSRKMKKNK